MFGRTVYQTIRWLIVLVSLSWVAWKLQNAQWDRFAAYAHHLTEWPVVMILLILAALNWYFEGWKWRMSLQGIQNLNRLQATAAILAGSSVSFFTPNRTGDFLGRWYWLKEKNRAFALPSSVVCGMTQLFVTLIAGLLAFAMQEHSTPSAISHNLWLVLVFLFAIMLALLIWRIDLLAAWIHKYLRYQKLEPYFNYVTELNTSTKLRITMLSMLRYLVFSLSFALILSKISGNQPLYWFPGIAKIYLLQTLTPSLAFAELGVRGSWALHVFKGAAADEALVFATFVTWLINLVIPALSGSILLMIRRS